MNIRKSTIYLYFFGLALLAISQSLYADDIDAYYAESPPVIDGDRGDWDLIPIYFNEDNNTAYGICHDSSSYYLLFSFNSPIYARLIKQKGLNIWINTKNKKNDDYGLNYSGGPGLTDIKKLSGPAMPERPQRTDNDRVNNKKISEPEGNPYAINLFFKDGIDEVVRLQETSEFDISFKVINGICAYEFKIPIEKFRNDDKESFFDNKKIKIGFSWGGMEMDRQDQGERGGKGGGGMGGGGRGGGKGGGGRGGGMGGGPPSGGGMSDQMAELSEYMDEQEIWITYKLKK